MREDVNEDPLKNAIELRNRNYLKSRTKDIYYFFASRRGGRRGMGVNIFLDRRVRRIIIDRMTV